ncbi:sodium- and chloride-dependent GABA transporter 1 isoform X1 [Patella vulgata]|uniref:sodium- and chloride-dependent GABA transporter 1 isoform X1 n=1 Tax=Patella vulgata TaxID=6465 RepID=UPI0024A85C0B|nr:sodium- and chloride-dependent GABA transporter 1 isoform X1 [Patella vulgata]XP_050406663.2 sodium- and chloride-dependent GABA transporter 1 isoform X1 [Patella vulgata]XP_050406664.2 sodium- and chloride-dependent GABA transporter 1 isoform X1 [Patella vulgata]
MESFILEKKDAVTKEESHRGQWKNGCEFTLSLIGYGVGLANVWRFPYLCAKNGGAVFLIPYAVFLVLLAFPMTLLELSIGQYSGKGAYDVWNICPAFRGIGAGMIGISFVFCLYVNNIFSWILYYLYNSFLSPLPWTTCDNWWNTDTCFVRKKMMSNFSRYLVNMTNNIANTTDTMHTTNYSLLTKAANITGNSSLIQTSTEEFWNYNVLRISSGIDDIGAMQWHLVISLVIAWIMVFLCILKGVKSVGKVVYVTAIAPYILVTIILIRAATLPGAIDGIKFYIIPDFSKLANPQIWAQAMMQIFFSMGMGWGALITMASYNKFNNNVMRDTIIYSIVCEGTSFYAGFAVFAVLGFMSHETGLGVAEIVRTGPGLAFITYPEALAQLPVPQLWAVLFFLMMVCVALDSMFVSVEVCVTTINDLIPNVTPRKRLMVTASTCFIMCLATLIYTTQAGVYIFQLVDWYMTSVTVFLTTAIEAIIIGWIYGADRFIDDMEKMLGKRPSVLFKILWQYVNPTLLIGLLVFTLVEYQPPSYGNYQYPSYAGVIGWIIALITSVPIPILMVKEIKSRKGSIIQRIKTSFQPNDRWGPAKGYGPVG